MSRELEVSIVAKSYAINAAATKRLDPEYFKRQYLRDEQLIAKNGSLFRSSGSLGITVDASAFYPSIEEYYETGELPFYRVGDVDGIIDEERALRVPEAICGLFPTLKKVSAGDILFTKGGAIDRSGYVRSAGAVSRDLIFLNTSQLPENERLCLFAYCGTGLFKRLLTRSSSQTAQPHLTITLVRELPLFIGSANLGRRVAMVINAAFGHVDAARDQMANAGQHLLAALGLANWTPLKPLAFTARRSDVISAGRVDAQYFRPLFAEVEERLRSTGHAIELGSILKTNARGRQPQYGSGLPVVNSRHVRTNRVILTDNRTAIEKGSPVVINNNDVLINGTGVGTIGRAAPYLHMERALPDNHVTVLRTDRLDPVYLAVFLNSSLGQWQIERHIKGSSGQIELYPHDIARIVVWEAPVEIQRSVRNAIMSAFQQEQLGRDLLKAATRAVEIAIEDDEPAAVAYLDRLEGAN